jgi:hypothetical protein
LTIWTKIATTSDGDVTEADLERAACRLDAQQVVFETDHGSRQHYALITRYLGAFREVFAPFGKDIVHRPHHGYVVCMGRHRIGPRLPLAQTRLALVLFRIYHDKMQRADIEDGAIVTETVEIHQAWTAYLGLDWSFRVGEFDTHIKALRRLGIVAVRDTEEPGSFLVVIRPSIEDVLGETVLHQMAQYGVGDEVDE